MMKRSKASLNVVILEACFEKKRKKKNVANQGIRGADILIGILNPYLDTPKFHSGYYVIRQGYRYGMIC